MLYNLITLNVLFLKKIERKIKDDIDLGQTVNRFENIFKVKSIYQNTSDVLNAEKKLRKIKFSLTEVSTLKIK